MNTATPVRTATRWFWALTALAVVLVGALSRELVATPGPLTGLTVAVTGILLTAVATQATRLMLALERAAPPSRSGRRRPTTEHPATRGPASRRRLSRSP